MSCYLRKSKQSILIVASDTVGTWRRLRVRKGNSRKVVDMVVKRGLRQKWASCEGVGREFPGPGTTNTEALRWNCLS